VSGESRTNEPAPGLPDGSGFPLTTHHSPLTTHKIRLGPPWEVTRDATHTRHARNFGRPRTLEPGERVWLVCDSLPGAAEVTVNGVVVGLPAAGAFAADITDHLRPRNVVVFAVAGGDPLGGIALEIRRA
jgi:hypothetical protein